MAGQAFVIIGFPVIMIILIVWFKSMENRQRNQLQSELFAKAIEKGQTLQENLFVLPKKKNNSLNTGILCIAFSLGISLYIWLGLPPLHNGVEPAAIGIIPFLIGIAFLIIHFIGKK